MASVDFLLLRYEGIRNTSCCPCVLFAIAGPYLCIMGAIFVQEVIVQPLTDYIWLGGDPHYDNRVVSLARIFHSTAKAITELREYYRNLTTRHTPDPARLLPRPTLLPSEGPLPFTLEYRGWYPADSRRVLYLAKKDGAERVVVKFTTRYGFEAHHYLASEHLAPTLYFCGRVHGGLWMVVTAEVVGVTVLATFGRRQASLDVITAVERAVSLLHNKDLVHGDLRPPNIMVVKKAAPDRSRDSGTGHVESTPTVILIDFDWAGLDGKARYPVTLNDVDSINWAPGVERNALMRKAHDEYMADYL